MCQQTLGDLYLRIKITGYCRVLFQLKGKKKYIYSNRPVSFKLDLDLSGPHVCETTHILDVFWPKCKSPPNTKAN